MSLLSLKRNTPTQDKVDCNVDEFINGAVAYANGVNVIDFKNQLRASHSEPEQTKPEPMTRHCFTLDDASKDKLNRLAAQTGSSRSEVIRRCLKNQPVK